MLNGRLTISPMLNGRLTSPTVVRRETGKE
jgi:hypothetical protein